MALSTLLVYVPLETIGEKRRYWETYVRFYEQYWGGPTSPFGVWFGQEYENFRRELSRRLGMDEGEIVDCYFMKSEGRYYVCPLEGGDNPYLLLAEDHIPFEWFLLFDAEERKYIQLQWGFGSIYYHTRLSKGLERLGRAARIAEGVSAGGEGGVDEVFAGAMADLARRARELGSRLGRHDPSSYLVLNYGELVGLIHPLTLKNEHSAAELWRVLEHVEEGRWQEATRTYTLLYQKWEEIRRKAAGQSGGEPLQ